MAHDYIDPDGVLISVADTGLLYSTQEFKGCKKIPADYRLIDLGKCTVTNEKLFYKGSLSEIWRLFEQWNDFGGVIYAPLFHATAQAEEAAKVSAVFDKAVGRI